MSISSFSNWLENEIEARGWDQSELARRAGLTRGTVSRILSETREAGPEAVIAIARAFGIPREEVFRRRGWLLREPTADAIDAFLDVVYALSNPARAPLPLWPEDDAPSPLASRVAPRPTPLDFYLSIVYP